MSVKGQLSPQQRERLEHAARLWAEGDSLSVIGFKVKCSKNVIAGLVHRYREKFPSREAPVNFGASGRPRLSDDERRSRQREREAKRRAEERAARGQAPAAPRAPYSLPLLPAVRLPSPWRTCQWIEGEARGGAKCGATCLEGRSWCQAHAVRVYVRAAQAVA